VLLCGVRSDLARKLENTGLATRIGDPIFREEKVRLTSTTMAIRHAYSLVDDPCPTCPRRGREGKDPALYYVI
jgi:hypothetical protein